jgi:hypothetical protein
MVSSNRLRFLMFLAANSKKHQAAKDKAFLLVTLAPFCG